MDLLSICSFDRDIELAEKIVDHSYKDSTLSDISTNLLKRGDINKAIEVARKIHYPYARDLCYEGIISFMLKLGVWESFNWGDISENDEETIIIDLGTRQWKLNPCDINHYLRLICSEIAKVRLVFRGHQHLKKHHVHEGRVVATTMPVGMNSVYAEYFHQPDVFYTLKTAQTVDMRTKSAHYRNSHENKTNVTAHFPIHEESISCEVTEDSSGEAEWCSLM